MNEEAFYIDTDTTIIISNLRDATSNDLISDATITGTLYTIAGVAVTGGDTPSVTCAAVGGTPGKYSGSLADGLELTAGIEYYLEMTIVKTTTTLKFRIVRKAQYYVE